MRGSVAVVMGILLAGCVTAPELPLDLASAAPTFSADCATGTVAPAGGVCAWFFAPGPERHYEASLAAHPTEAGTVLVTWTERGGGNAKIWSSITTDGGATWRTTHMHDPAVLDPDGSEPYGFDSIADFTSDGRAVVFFGGEGTSLTVPVGPARAYTSLTDRMTVAISDDAGASWAFHALSADPVENRLYANDFMDIGVSPDGDDMVVVAQAFTTAPVSAFVATPVMPLFGGVFEPAGAYVWTSHDGGATWSSARRLDTLPDQAVVPRVSMGPDGLVVVTAARITQVAWEAPSIYKGLAAYVSRDAGETFEAAVELTGPDSDAWLGLGAPAIVVGPDGTLRIDVLLNEGRKVLVLTSRDGLTWDGPALVAEVPEGTWAWWSIPTLGPDGVLHVLAQYTNACTEEGEDARAWGMAVYTRVADTTSTVALTDVLDRSPTGCWASNDYGGIDVAADGSLWAAWSDPRVEAERPHLAVARLAP